jgi:hypothetical protein
MNTTQSSKQLIFIGLMVLGVALVHPSTAQAIGNATFQCGGGEFKTTWYGKDTLVRELTFPLTTTTVDGKNYTVRFLGRAVIGQFSGVNISSIKEKFTLYHDRANLIHQLTYQMENGNTVRANCTILTYK